MLQYGTEEQKREWIEPLATSERFFAFGITELNHGSDATHMETRAVNEDYLRTTSVAAPADRVWLAVAGAYDDLKLPITTRVDASRQVASQGRRFRGSIGGTRLGILFNCGSSAAGGDLADSYELTVDVASTVAPAADAAQSTVQSVVSALARPVMTSGEPVRCASTGRLEQKIVEEAAKRLQR